MGRTGHPRKEARGRPQRGGVCLPQLRALIPTIAAAAVVYVVLVVLISVGMPEQTIELACIAFSVGAYAVNQPHLCSVRTG